jgi:hypothetical protein
MQLSSNENTITLASDAPINSVSALSIGQGLQVSLDPGPYSGVGTAPSSENTGLPSDVSMNDGSTLSISQAPQVLLDPASYSGGGTAPPPSDVSMNDRSALFISQAPSPQVPSSENTGLPSDVSMNDGSALSISQAPQVLLDPGSYSGGGTAPPHEFFPDNPIGRGMNMTNISTQAEASEGVPAQHSMAENNGVDGGTGTKKPSKMRPGNSLTPR